MSDAVKIALIVGLCTAVPAVLGIVVNLLVFFRTGRVESKVDGNFSEMKSELAKVTAERLTLTEKASHAAGVKEGEDGQRQ